MKKKGKIVKTLPSGHIETIYVDIPPKKTRKPSTKKAEKQEE